MSVPGTVSQLTLTLAIVPPDTVLTIPDTLSFDFKGSSIYSELYFWGGDSPNISKAVSNGKNTYTITNSGTTTKIQLYATGGGSFSNIQIEKGNTATPYEPYEPRIIKPSGIVESSGKNLWNAEIEVGAIDGSGKRTPSTTRVRNKEDFNLKSGIYTISAKNVTSVVVYKFINGVKVNTPSWVDLPYTFTMENDGFIRFALQKSNETLTVDSVKDLQIEKGNVATDYEEYKGQSTIELPFVPLGINDIKDELIVYADGTGKFVKRINEIDLSTLNWQMSSSTQGGFYAEQSRGTLLDYKLINNVPSICSIYEYQGTINQGSTALVNNGNYALFYLSSTQNLEGIYMRDTKYSSVADFKTSLNGVLLIYELATPQEITLTQAQVEQILALKTFADVTYIDADGLVYEIGYIMNSAKAIKDLKNIIQSLVSAQTVDDVMESKSLKSAKVVEQIATPIEDDLKEAMPEEDR